MKITIFDERETWKDYEAIEEYGKQKLDFLREFLKLGGGFHHQVR